MTGSSKRPTRDSLLIDRKRKHWKVRKRLDVVLIALPLPITRATCIAYLQWSVWKHANGSIGDKQAAQQRVKQRLDGCRVDALGNLRVVPPACLIFQTHPAAQQYLQPALSTNSTLTAPRCRPDSRLESLTSRPSYNERTLESTTA
jgi:hypothetical protein